LEIFGGSNLIVKLAAEAVIALPSAGAPAP
jgi:hypothetical protein